MMELLQEFIIEPFSFAFMQRALVASVLIGITCSLFSCFLVLKGWSLMGDAVSHAVLPGLVLSILIGIPFLIGAFISGILCAFFIGFIKEKTRVKEDAVMGIVFSGMFAFGLVLLGQVETDLQITHILFGNVLGIRGPDFIVMSVIACISMGLILAMRRDLMLYCFDAVQVTALGLSAKRIYFSLLFLLSLTIVASLQAAGIILVIAMLIAPGATAFLCSKSFDRMMMISASTSVISCTGGVLLSYHLDVATAPLIVVIQAFIFTVALSVNLVQRHLHKEVRI